MLLFMYLGMQLVNQALEAGHQVTALVRNPAKMTVENENLTTESIDIFDKEVIIIFIIR